MEDNWAVRFENPLQTSLVELPIFKGVLSVGELFGEEYAAGTPQVGTTWGGLFIITRVDEAQRMVEVQPILNFINDLTRNGWTVVFHNHTAGQRYVLAFAVSGNLTFSPHQQLGPFFVEEVNGEGRIVVLQSIGQFLDFMTTLISEERVEEI